ncbi:hypothetical protein M5D96_012813 [Drosophila gunungcola]|uniref:Uncharacterized protein n=1 Tax=Drosophila gunungcola TaxID=103775 RepID=A0A9P9YCL2_9MUSC|nr:hypothetical protein M5D96_012813 [Drosophila gunungcola]
MQDLGPSLSANLSAWSKKQLKIWQFKFLGLGHQMLAFNWRCAKADPEIKPKELGSKINIQVIANENKGKWTTYWDLQLSHLQTLL